MEHLQVLVIKEGGVGWALLTPYFFGGSSWEIVGSLFVQQRTRGWSYKSVSATCGLQGKGAWPADERDYCEGAHHVDCSPLFHFWLSFFVSGTKLYLKSPSFHWCKKKGFMRNVYYIYCILWTRCLMDRDNKYGDCCSEMITIIGVMLT